MECQGELILRHAQDDKNYREMEFCEEQSCGRQQRFQVQLGNEGNGSFLRASRARTTSCPGHPREAPPLSQRRAGNRGQARAGCLYPRWNARVN
jgi:hypothetical protein